MALDLSGQPLLEAAQDSQSRHPLVEIISSPTIPDIPFDGQFLTTETEDEQKPNGIFHSSGRIIMLYTLDSDNIRYAYTDVNQGAFTIVDIPVPNLIEATLVELSNGNIGIVYISGTTTLYLKYLIITPEGAIVTTHTTIASYTAADEVIDNPFVYRLADDSYILVYAYEDTSGPTYQIMSRTATDFTDWTDPEVACSIAGISADNPIRNPSLLQIVGGEILLFFDYADTVLDDLEIRNIYYSLSADNGENWGAAVKITDYDTFGTIGTHPIAIQKEDGQITLIYNEESGAIHMDSSTSGYCGDGNLTATDLTFDATLRKLYVLSTKTGTGNKILRCVLKIDIDSWTIDDCWDCSTVPAFNSVFCDHHVWYMRWRGDRYLIPVGSGEYNVISVLDGEADTIILYANEDVVDHGITKNISGWNMAGYEQLQKAWVDFDSKRLYLLSSSSTYQTVRLGYIDLTDSGPTYAYTQLIATSTFTVCGSFGEAELFIDVSNDLVVIGFNNITSNWKGETKIYHLSTGLEYKAYSVVTNVGYPWKGLRDPVLVNGKLYGGFTYCSYPGETEKRGLCEIDLSTDVITYKRPTWDTIDEYGLWYGKTVTSDDRIIMCCTNGITIYDVAIGGWSERFNNDSVPGLDPEGNNDFLDTAYDESTGIIFTGTAEPFVGTSYLCAFSELGFLKRSQYRVDEYVDLPIAAQNPLVLGLVDYDLIPVLTNDDIFYGFWTDSQLTEYSIKWDIEDSEMDLSSYVVNGTDVSVRRSIDGSPAKLEFTLSHGQYFDPTNNLSVWSIVLRKGRRINLRFGEKVSGAPYWQQQGVFFVRETSIGYKRPQYPTISVVAEDLKTFWDVGTIIATEFYETDPKTILEDIMTSLANLDLGDTAFPVFDDATTIYYQWIESTILQMVKDLCNRFAYFPRIDIDGKVTARKISDSNTVDHIYSDLTKIIDYTPDDSFSDFVNQIIVVGESHDYIEVLHEEEAVGQNITGSSGWYGKHKNIAVWYSKDHSQVCRYPRMQVVQSVKDGPYLCKYAPGEWILSIREDEKGLVVRVEDVDLVAQVIATLILYFILIMLCNAISWVPAVSTACGIAEANTMFNLMTAFGTQTMYSYNFYARPVGKVRQSFQATADDEDLQNEIGYVIPRKIEDPFCYDLAHCQFVADFELLVVKLQRSRVKFTKLAHLQDEEGDTLQIPHPFSGMDMKFFITELTRKFKKSSSPYSNDGYFLDEMEGWKLP